MAGIVGQSDYYGLPEQNRPEPPAGEHLAELLKKPTPWSGPAKLAADDEPSIDDEGNTLSDLHPGEE